MLGRIWTHQGCRLSRPASRCQFKNNYSVLHEPAFEHIDIPCGVSTPITIKIHNPPSPSSPLPILLYITTSPPSSSPPPTPLPLLSQSHTTIHIPLPSSPVPFPHPLHKLLYAYTHILSLLRPAQTRLHAQPTTRYPPIAVYGSSYGGSLGGGTGGSLATALALTESLTALGVGRYPSALVTTDSIFDYSPLAIASIHPSFSIHTTSPLKIRPLFPNPRSTLDPLASPLLFFRGAAFHLYPFPSAWLPRRKEGTGPPPPSRPLEWCEWTESRDDLELRCWAAPRGGVLGDDGMVVVDRTGERRRSYRKFPPKNEELKIPRCNFQVSHPIPSPLPPSKPSKPGRPSKASKSAPPAQEGPDEPQEVSQAQLMASAINRSVKLGYDNPLSRRGDDDAGEVERAVVSELEGAGEVEERGAVGAREWLREVMDWR